MILVGIVPLGTKDLAALDDTFISQGLDLFVSTLTTEGEVNYSDVFLFSSDRDIHDQPVEFQLFSFGLEQPHTGG